MTQRVPADNGPTMAWSLLLLTYGMMLVLFTAIVLMVPPLFVPLGIPSSWAGNTLAKWFNNKMRKIEG